MQSRDMVNIGFPVSRKHVMRSAKPIPVSSSSYGIVTVIIALLIGSFGGFLIGMFGFPIQIESVQELRINHYITHNVNQNIPTPVDAINISTYFTDQNILTNYTVAYGDSWSDSREDNGSLVTLESSKTYLVPFNVSYGSVLRNISFWIDTDDHSGDTPSQTYVDLLLLRANDFPNGDAYIRDWTLAIGQTSEAILWVMDTYLENGSYFIWITSNYNFRFGGSDYNASFTIQETNGITYFDLGSTTNMNFTYDAVTYVADTSIPLDLGKYIFQYVNLNVTQPISLELFFLAQFSEPGILLNTWNNFSLDSDTPYHLSALTLKLYNDNIGYDGEFEFGGQNPFYPLINYNFTGGNTYIVKIVSARLILFSDCDPMSSFFNPYLMINMSINNEIFHLGAYWAFG